jgi:hypothetical protein
MRLGAKSPRQTLLPDLASQENRLSWARHSLKLTTPRRPFARRCYLRPSIHSVSACEPRPSAASMAALYPCRAWSLDTTPLVRGFKSRSARKPATASEKPPLATQMSARCFAQVSCSSRLFMEPCGQDRRHQGCGVASASKLLGSAFVVPMAATVLGESRACIESNGRAVAVADLAHDAEYRGTRKPPRHSA